MSSSVDRPWWEDLPDHELLAELRAVGVQEFVARQVVTRRTTEGARERLARELGVDRVSP